MAKSEQKFQVNTKPIGEWTPEEIKAEEQRIAQQKRSIIRDLNKINYPISATVFTHNRTWTIRNISFWQHMNKRDEEILDFMEKYITEEK